METESRTNRNINQLIFMILAGFKTANYFPNRYPIKILYLKPPAQ